VTAVGLTTVDSRCFPMYFFCPASTVARHVRKPPKRSPESPLSEEYGILHDEAHTEVGRRGELVVDLESEV